jgi:Phage protein Gp19/Gp15/Gp42
VSTFAQVEHVEEAWTRPFGPREVPHVQAALNRAEREVARSVDVKARIAASLTTIEDVRDALVSMVVRMMRNPGGVRSQSSGPFSQVIDASVASGRLEITRAERRALGMGTGATTVQVADLTIGAPVRHRITSSGLVSEAIIP